MPVDSKHPSYIDREKEWALMRDAARGEKAIKEAGEAYLPMPSGFRFQADSGKSMYNAYATRAEFAEIVEPTLQGMVGVIHRTEAQIEVPDALKKIWERATPDNLPLEAFHKRITSEILLLGRYNLLTDLPSTGGDLPYLAGYSAESLINWTSERDLFVLDESGAERSAGDEFEWKDVKRHRVLRLLDGQYSVECYREKASEGIIIPTQRGGRALSEIPFVVIGARDLALEPTVPPLIGVARAALAMYQLSADYRHQLFMTGQETLFVINGSAPEAVGAGVVVSLMGDEGLRPDAKYVGPAGVGIEAHRQAILDRRAAAVAAGARLFDGEKREAESGEALKLRYAAQTATLTSVAQASAQGLEKALRYAAIMVGADPEKVIVKPNLKFIDSTMTPAEAEKLVSVWQSGAISYRTLYENLQRGEIASAERSDEDEKELIEQEVPDVDVPSEDIDEAA